MFALLFALLAGPKPDAPPRPVSPEEFKHSSPARKVSMLAIRTLGSAER
jgi:hypothetical protein